jgi:Tfp pilus assembly protein PilO
MKNIFSIIFIGAAIASFVIIVQPRYKEIQELQKKSGELEQVLANARKLQSLRDELLEKRNSLNQTDLTRLEKMVPDSVDNVKLILELQNIANQYNLQIEAANTNKEETTEEGKEPKKEASLVDVESRDYGIITLNFNITGNYQNFLSFLRDIERNLRVTDIRNVAFASDGTGVYSFQLSLDTYWLKDNI